MKRQKKQRKIGKIGICCYEFQTNQQECVEEKSQNIERMPMLKRQMSSNIRFKNVQYANNQPIYQLLNQLYEGTNPSFVIFKLGQKRINPIIGKQEERDDFQYYIPQIITFLVLQKNLQDQDLSNFIINACITDFYFAHLVYFYLKSLSQDHQGNKIQSVQYFLQHKFMSKMSIYQNSKLSGMQFTKSMIQMDFQFNSRQLQKEQKQQIQQQILPQKRIHQNISNRYKYGTKNYPSPLPVHPPTVNKIQMKRYHVHGFLQTPVFWDQLLQIGNKIVKIQANERNEKLAQYIQEINQKIPAKIYVPFFKQQIRLYTILCVWKGRLFATKQRAPYSIWIQIYREQQQSTLPNIEQVEQQKTEYKNKLIKKTLLQKIYETISRPFVVNGSRNTLNMKKDKILQQHQTSKMSLIQSSFHKTSSKNKNNIYRSFVEGQKVNRQSISEIYNEQNGTKSDRKSSKSSMSSHHSQLQDPQLRLNQYFGTKSTQHIKQIKKRSIYRQLKSWRTVHMMVKTGDDIKQEQFAMQLLNRFQQAFITQKIDCLLFPYQVISLGPDSGLIEMLNDVTTLNSIFQKINSQGISLRRFFDTVFPNPVLARKNFMKSLAGYSILSYFLQIKDRHNGNILLNRQGHIIHIDFGFFLSNLPGRGVELQRNVPFKLLTAYVQVIGALDSQQFFEFRRLFFKGFSAVLKHKQPIITLVKMMFSSHSQSMSCFIKGFQAIEQLEQRFSITNGVQSFCYDLINSSLDNWRARWYDKFQYFLQKIYY